MRKEERPKTLTEFVLDRLLLVGGSSDGISLLLEKYFEGKPEAEVREGLACLLLIAKENIGPRSVILEYVIAAAERVGFRLEPNESLFGVFLDEASQFLSSDPVKQLEEGLVAFGRIARLFRATTESGAAFGPAIIRWLQACVEKPFMWMAAVAHFDQGGLARHGLTSEDARPMATGNVGLGALYREHCREAVSRYERREEPGFLAAVRTLSGEGKGPSLQSAYHRAREAGCYIPIDLPHLWGQDPTPNAFLFRPCPTREAILTQLFGDRARDPDFVLPMRAEIKDQHGYPDKIRFYDAVKLTPEGDVHYVNDPEAQRVAEVFLSRGHWQEAMYAMYLLTPSPPKQNRHLSEYRVRRLSGALLPAMCIAEREGRLAVAAALGQAILARDSLAKRESHEFLTLEATCRDIYSKPLWKELGALEAEIHRFEHPESFDDQLYHSAPKEMYERRDALNERLQDRTEPERLFNVFVARIGALLDGVIERGECLELDVL